MNEILYRLCWHGVSFDSWIPYPSTLLSKQCNLSLYKTRKELKNLKEKGLVDTDVVSIPTEEGSRVRNGWTITRKAMETEEYKTAQKKNLEILQSVFDNIDFPDTNTTNDLQRIKEDS